MNESVYDPPIEGMDSDKYNSVHVVADGFDEEPGVTLDPEVVYMTIPSLWVPIYRKLLLFIADYGKSILDDCSFGCKGNGSVIFNCWNLFQSACAAYAIEDFERATLFINYVSKQIDSITKSSTKTDDGVFRYTITPDGAIRVDGTIVNDKVNFSATKSTYDNYQEWLKNYQVGQVFVKEDDNE